MKNINYPGKEYFDRAAQHFEWPIDHHHKHILVPADELDKAANNLMVLHFRSYGWHVQSVIPGSINKNKIYEPEFILKGVRPKEQPVETGHKEGDKFRIKSTDCELQITRIDGKKMHMSYTNRSKSPLISGVENLDKMLNQGYWVKL